MKKIRDDVEFERMKKTIQDILDRHLPSDKKILVKNYNKEQIWYMCRLLLEKNVENRMVIWNEIFDKLKNTRYEYEKQYHEICIRKEEFDNYVSNLEVMDKLFNDIDAENNMDENLKNI